MLEPTVTIVNPATGNVLEDHYAQDGWGSDIEHPRPMFCETADGTIHTFTFYSPVGTVAIYHHWSTDEGQTWTSEDITDGDTVFHAIYLGPVVRRLACAAHGDKIIVIFRAGTSKWSDYYEKVFDGSAWSDVAELPWSGDCAARRR